MMEKLLTVPEMAQILGCHEQTVYRNQELPIISLPGVGKRCRESDLNKYLEQKTSLISSNYHNNQSVSLTKTSFEPILLLGGETSGMPKGKNKTRYNFGYGAIYQRKTKQGKIRWYLDYRDGDGKRIQKVALLATTKEEAIVALREEAQGAFDRGYGIKREKEKIGFQSFSKLYLKDYAMIAKKSWETDKYRLNVLCEFFQDTPLKEITPLMIQKFRASRLNTGNSKSTTNRYLTLMKKLFAIAIEEGYVSENPVRKVKFYSEKDNLKERVLTESEEPDLLHECMPHLKSILKIAINTGMRRGEILNLKWRNVDWAKRVIKVEKTKSGKVRFIPINQTLFGELVARKSQNSNSSLVVYNPETGKSYVDIRTAFQGACRRAGIEGLRFHDLRHTFASRLISKGIDIVTVQALLGHSTISVTQRYTHADDVRKIQAVELLDKKDGKTGEKRSKLLHSCDMTRVQNLREFVSSLISAN